MRIPDTTCDYFIQEEKRAGVYDCDQCETYPCECGPDPDWYYDLAEGK